MFDAESNVNLDNQKKVEKVKSLLKDFNLDIERERYKFLQHFVTLINEWNGPFPNLREIFQNEEIERLLSDSISHCGASNDFRAELFIDFVVRSGYKDEPKLDAKGKPLCDRTTPLHQAARFEYDNIVRELFKIYDRFDVNYIDEFGYTHYDVAFEFDCKKVIEKFLELGQDPNCLVRKSNSISVYPSLHVALIKRSRSMVRLLLKKGADSNLPNAQGLTALHIIGKSHSDDHDLARILFKHSQEKYRPVLVDAKDKLGRTPLHYAVTEPNKEHSIRVLLENGADPNVSNAKGLSPLQVICQGNRDNYNLVKMLIELSSMYNKPVQVNVQDKLGNTPLLRVLLSNHRNLFELLLQSGADPNVTNKQGFTALHIISKRYWVDDLADMVFEVSHKKYQPLQIDVQDKDGNTPLHLALMYEKKKVAELLLKRGANPNLPNLDRLTPLHIISKMHPDINWIESFFDICDRQHHTMQVNVLNKDGNTPLHLALKNYNRKVSELLLARGANPNLTNAQGLTPLHIICMMDRTNVNAVTARMLFKRSHNQYKPLRIDTLNKTGNTPLHEALLHNGLENAAFLMRNGADMNVANARRSTPLHIICEYMHLYDLARLLFQISHEKNRTVPINARNSDGNTPLHLALYLRNGSMVCLLLRNGADPNSVNVKNLTPLHVICKEPKNSDMVGLFFEITKERHLQVQVNAVDRFHKTPLQWAVSNFKLNAVDLLLVHGADLSNFNFPTANYHCDHMKCPNDKFKWASSVMAVAESLEKKGYELQESDVLTIVKYFVKYELFEKSDHNKSWRDDDMFKSKAKEIVINPSLSLYDLIQLRPNEAVKLVTYADCLKLARSKNLRKLERHIEVCALHLCEKMSRRFFVGWALDCFLKLIHQRLPLLCCDMIIEELANKDLCNIFLANVDQSQVPKC